MPWQLLALPLSNEDLRALADGGYTLVDQAARTPGLLIASAPDQASGERRAATEDDADGSGGPSDETPAAGRDTN